MDLSTLEPEHAQVLLAHKQVDQARLFAGGFNQVSGCDIRMTMAHSVDDVIRELETARFDLVLCDRRLLTVKLIEAFNRLRARGEHIATVLLSNEADDQVRNTGRAIGALDAIPLSVVSGEALAYYLNVALRLGALARQERQAGQVMGAIGSFGDVFFFRARLEQDRPPILDWISSSFVDVSGYPTRDFLEREDGVWSLVEEEDRSLVQDWIEALSGNRRAACEFRLIDHLGRALWVEAKGHPIWSHERQCVTGILGRVSQIGARRHLEARAEHAEARRGLLHDFIQSALNATSSSSWQRAIPQKLQALLKSDVVGLFERKGNQFAMVAGAGWKLNAPSDRFLHGQLQHELSFTLERQEPVLIEKMQSETRFSPSHIALGSGVVSGVCLAIKGPSFEGVLAVYFRESYMPLDADDLNWLQLLADWLAGQLGEGVSATAERLEDNNSYLQILMDVGDSLLNAPDWRRANASVLNRVGVALDARSLACFRFSASQAEEQAATVAWSQQWQAEGQKASAPSTRLLKGVFAGETQQEKDICAVPIRADGSVWGGVVVEGLQADSTRLALLKQLADLIGAVAEREAQAARLKALSTAADSTQDILASTLHWLGASGTCFWPSQGQATWYTPHPRLREAVERLGSDASPVATAFEGEPIAFFPEGLAVPDPALQQQPALALHFEQGRWLLFWENAVPLLGERDYSALKQLFKRVLTSLRQEQETESAPVNSVEANPLPFAVFDSQGELQSSNASFDEIWKQELSRPEEHRRLVQTVAAQTTPESVLHDAVTPALLWSYAPDRSGSVFVQVQIVPESEAEQHSDAFHDFLTGLPNREFFKKLLSHSLEQSQRNTQYEFAVLMLDLDRFKVINDSLGHEEGDRVLQEVATRLVEAVRAGDYVARLGGDEFAILLDGIGDDMDASDIASDIQRELQKTLHLGEHEAVSSASIGIALSSRGYQHVEDLIRDADSAMYHAKNHGKAQHSVFSQEMHQRALDRLQLEADLRRSVEANQLRVHYQPIIDLAQDKVAGFEALVRWHHPSRGLLFPDDFVPMAEETGYIRNIDRWVLDNATNTLTQWRQMESQANDLFLSLNLSGLHFDNMAILSHIGNLLSSKDLSGRLKLELTESILMQNSSRALEMFNILAARGLHISIDDFGVGYSSLSRIRRLPLNTLKIDKSFVQDMQRDQGALDIIRAIIDLAYNLKMEVVAEGIETAHQYTLLKRLGCHYGQGYYMSRPLPEDRALEFLQTPLELKRA
ncbi:diguanylate cyclase/phosphodiesterase [gamma proteobacterium HTCC5015]|nr:diguanylate cyclase/phosphodiesterase [gamma proteobacterium HTCC5015]